MDTKPQKERLEQELRFLKESFEAEVISKDEFEKGKERIERKLNELDYLHKSDIESKMEEKNQTPEPAKQAEDNYKEEEEQTDNDLNDSQADYQAEVKEEKKEPKLETVTEPERNRQKGPGFWKYATILLILVLAAVLAFNFFKPAEKDHTGSNMVILCSSDSDCILQGKAGACIEPGKEHSKCVFSDINKVRVLIVNDKSTCINCDTSRVVGILNQWFGPLNVSEISYSTARGKELASKHNAKLLPLYVLDSEVENRENFPTYQKSFAKNEGVYILSDRVSGSSIYINRQEIGRKLDLFVKEGDSSSRKAEENLKEFLSTFDVTYEKHSSNSALAKELGLNIYPVFLVNNKVKFTGVHAAEGIKQNYCKLNDDPGCKNTLSSSLK